jgi:hypothetical protein|tara:strand:- start:736 stop:1641 length:906 start_codon:yes stop_codon:yes gene_type:complete
MTTDMTFNNKLSLFIPRIVPEWACKDMIVDKFKALDIGIINRVDFLEKHNTNGVKYFQAFLHFDYWYDNDVARNIQDRIYESESNARLVYDQHWYWILLKNNNPLTEEEVVSQSNNVALQEQVSQLEEQVSQLEEQVSQFQQTNCDLEEQVLQIQTNMIYWNNLVLTQMNCYNNQLAPLWAHAINNGMGEIHPEWVNNDDIPPTMSQLAEQSAMIDGDMDTDDTIPPPIIDTNEEEEEEDTDTETESESSSLPALISDNESEYSEDESIIHTSHFEDNYMNTSPYHLSTVIDLTNIFNTVG